MSQRGVVDPRISDGFLRHVHPFELLEVDLCLIVQYELGPPTALLLRRFVPRLLYGAALPWVKQELLLADLERFIGRLQDHLLLGQVGELLLALDLLQVLFILFESISEQGLLFHLSGSQKLDRPH